MPQSNERSEPLAAANEALAPEEAARTKAAGQKYFGIFKDDDNLEGLNAE